MENNVFAALEALPRVQLAFLPTPITPLPRLSAWLGGPPLYIKRDDQTGLATGGNKARKLEFFLAQAREAEADCVITAGSTQSNHARQTAAGAAMLGLAAHLVLYAPQGQPPEQVSGNLLLDHLLGATIHWTEERAPYTETIERVRHELQAKGHQSYVVPYGGSSATGALGYVAAMQEFVEQSEAPDAFGVHVFATSSGGTQAGMLLGAHLAGLLDRVQVLGISVDRPAASLAADVIRITTEAARLLDLDWQPAPEVIHIDDRFRGGGYAVVGEPEREAIRLLAQYEGILVDPVYTGRALAGLIGRIRQGEMSSNQRVLFWHTGGTAALSAFAHALGMA